MKNKMRSSICLIIVPEENSPLRIEGKIKFIETLALDLSELLKESIPQIQEIPDEEKEIHTQTLELPNSKGKAKV